MNKMTTALAALVALACLAPVSLAETTVQITNLHLCCKGCVKGVTKAVDGVKGASIEIGDQKAGKASLAASDAKTAQAALDAIAEAGYFARTQGPIQMKPIANIPSGKVKKLELAGIHNCCGKCQKAVNAAIAKVPGASGEIAKKATAVTVTGDFNAKALVKAVTDAGFTVKVN